MRLVQGITPFAWKFREIKQASTKEMMLGRYYWLGGGQGSQNMRIWWTSRI